MHWPAPLPCPEARVEADWIDYNGHMNMAYYSVAFDRALDSVLDRLGIGADYAGSGQGSTFVLDARVGYIREAMRDDPLAITFHLLDCDEKRMHYIEFMHHARDGHLIATSEQLLLHVSMQTRRAAPFPDRARDALVAMLEAHRSLPVPEQVGRPLGIRRRAST